MRVLVTATAMARVSVLIITNLTAWSTAAGTRAITLGPIAVVATGTAAVWARAARVLFALRRVVADHLRFLRVGAAALLAAPTAAEAEAEGGVKPQLAS